MDLQPGDEINISVDGQTAEIINAAGDVVGSFTARAACTKASVGK
ncbi:hypothetical protein CDB402_1936 [Corynebacterium diphtheriae INCA 402]|nr:hypothetical protein CDB402_1936 [Corynebacterium diphtheriae INCA 402]